VSSEEFFRRLRVEMVERQLYREGVTDPRVLEAMERIPRHAYMPESTRHMAYLPQAVDIGEGQTISQPLMVGSMTQALHLTGDESVLEVGTGSGYQAAILAWLARRVVSIERLPALAAQARANLSAQGLQRVDVVVGDGSDPSFLDETFDRIVVTAAAPQISRAWLDRLADPGILVCPVGSRDLQVIEVVHRSRGEDRVETGTACRFVPLLGSRGFDPDRT
jgi:protein-L-isoaspartate(D-aspartate) O-methyltransferase